MRLINGELFRCARFFVVIFHVILCHFSSFARRCTLRYEETRTYGVRTAAVCTTSMNANRRRRQTHNITCSSSSRRAKLPIHTAARSRGGTTRTTADSSKCSMRLPLASLVVLASLCPKISRPVHVHIDIEENTSYERTFWCAAAVRPSSTRQVLHEQKRTRVQGTGPPNRDS